MNILMLLTKPFLSDGRVLREAHTLRDQGHQVTVLEWARHEPEMPSVEDVDGIRIHRVLDPFPAMGGTVFRNPAWWRTATKTAAALHDERPLDVVHCHDLDTLVPGVRIKRRTGATLIYDAHEIFAYMIEGDHSRLVAAVADRLERRLLPHVDHLITVNDAIADHYRSLGVDSVYVVMNCPPLPPEPAPMPGGPFTVTYIGVLHDSRFFPDAVHALGGMDGVRLVIAGKKEGCFDEVRDASVPYDNVDFLGTIPASQVMEITQEGHAILCLFDPTARINQIGSPNKLYEAMAAGRPLIAAKGTYSGTFVEEHGIGVAIDYAPEALRVAVRALADDLERAGRLGLTGRKLAKERFHWSRQADVLTTLYEKASP